MFPPPANTTIQRVIESYLYQQYADDDALQAFVAAYNALAQNYVDTFNTLNLPVYTGAVVSGPLLDWVAMGLYGMERPTLPAFGSGARGPYNTAAYNSLAYNGWVGAVTPATFATSDDIFKRILTWHLYKGDGKVFNMRWLKRRIERFLTGPNGIDPIVVSTYEVSVALTGPYDVTIALANTPDSKTFKAALLSGALEFPFQLTPHVTLT